MPCGLIHFCRTSFAWLVIGALASCASSPPFQQPAPGHAVFGKAFTFDAREPWHRTGLMVVKGRRYCIQATASDYNDGGVPCTPRGPSGLLGAIFDGVSRDAQCPLNLARYLGPGKVKHLRVLSDRDGRRASFLTLIAAIGEDDRKENVVTVGDGLQFEAGASGELVLFANDWPGLPAPPQSAGDYYQCDGRWVASKSYLNNHGTLTVTVCEVCRR